MVPLERLSLEHHGHEDCEDRQGNHFLDDLELHKVERTAVLDKADAVGRHLCAVFKKGHTPREEDDKDERPACRDLHLLKLQVTIPCECHEYIRCYQKEDCPKCFHFVSESDVSNAGAKVTLNL